MKRLRFCCAWLLVISLSACVSQPPVHVREADKTPFGLWWGMSLTDVMAIPTIRLSRAPTYNPEMRGYKALVRRPPVTPFIMDASAGTELEFSDEYGLRAFNILTPVEDTPDGKKGRALYYQYKKELTKLYGEPARNRETIYAIAAKPKHRLKSGIPNSLDAKTHFYECLYDKRGIDGGCNGEWGYMTHWKQGNSDILLLIQSNRHPETREQYPGIVWIGLGRIDYIKPRIQKEAPQIDIR